ncbi:MAG: hypothetical protein KC766_23035 [Myxococcales bacterium]|nr:hypothetical protein [Myxococcales bacterium]
MATAVEPIEVWQQELDAALEVLRTHARLIETGAQPGPDFEALRVDLEATHRHLLTAYDREADPVTELVAARGFLDRATASLVDPAQSDPVLAGVVDGFRKASVHLQRAEERVRSQIHVPPPAPGDQRASVRTPRLNRLARQRITPHWRFPPAPPPEVTEAPAEPLPPPRSFEELEANLSTLKDRAAARAEAAKERASKPKKEPVEALEPPEPPPGFARDPLPRLSSAEFAQQNARLCFEEVAMVGMARLPMLNEPWRTMETFDQRMLNSIDAIIALGPSALEQLEGWVVDSPAPDAFRVWAITMILGCVDGRDALAAAERAFHRVALADDQAITQFGRALQLVPHRGVVPLARKLLRSPQPANRGLGVEVLVALNAITPEELEWAAFAEPELVTPALLPLALAGHPRVRDAVNHAYALPGPAVRHAVWEAMAASQDPRFTYTLHQELGGELHDDAVLMLGALGGQQEVEQLFKSFSSQPQPIVASALGWAGDAAHIEPLMQTLKGKDAELALAAAFALERITAAGLFEEVEVPPEELEEPDAPEPITGDEPEPLAKLISDPRDMPEPGSPDLMNFPTVEFNRWYRWWKENAQRFVPGQRFRRGVPYTPLVSWNELDAAPCTPGERRMLQRELIYRTGSFVPFSVEWFVPRQDEALIAWESPARSASTRPGAWTVPSRRS